MHRITALCWASETYIMYCIKRHALNDMHMDIAFPRLLCSFQVLSSPCYFTSARRTAAQVQLKYAFSCCTTPSSVLLVLSLFRFIQYGRITWTMHDLFAKKGSFVQSFKIFKHSLLRIMFVISDLPDMKLVH